MRILELAPYALIPGKAGFEKNRSGLAVAIGDICKALAEENDVFLLTQSAFTDSVNMGSFKCVRKKLSDILLNFKIRNLKCALKACSGLRAPIFYKSKVLMYFISEGYVEKIIKQIKPDIVHIHTIGYYSLPYIMACINCNVPFVVTLHGVITFLSPKEIDEKQRRLEKTFCELASRTNIPITVVSSGVKRRFLETFNIEKDVFTVVLNGYKPFDNTFTTSSSYEELGIQKGSKVYICVSSITENKNQTQIVRAFNQMRKEIRDNSFLLFLGDGPSVNKLNEEIEKTEDKTRIKYCGRVPHKDIYKYYSIANINVTASVEEGFGLPIIESMSFGIPTVVFDDLDAVNDLYNESNMIKVTERTDTALSAGMEEAYLKIWDKQRIQELSQEYSCKKMAQNYLRVFQESVIDTTSTSFEDLYKLL